MLNNSDKLDHLIALAATKCTAEEAQALNELDTSAVVFDPSYYRKRSKAIKACRRRPGLKITKAVLIRIAAVIAIMTVLAGALIGCSPKLREAIYNAIVEWYNDYFSVRYEDPVGKEKETVYVEESTTANKACVCAPKYIEDIRKPRDLPEGVWEDVLKQNNTQIIIDYYIGEEYLFSFSQSLLKPIDKCVDTEDVDITYVEINGYVATAVEYLTKKEVYVLWNDSEYSYHIFSTECDLETLIEYAKSVK